MKKLILLLFLLITRTTFAQVQNGAAVPDINFETVLNSPIKQIKLNQMKGKIVILEFWATWCGSCLEAMPHLKGLQKKYKDKLRVITVTNESPKRTEQYLTYRPSNLWLAVDTNEVISSLFPHHSIPHTVLISSAGTLIANTSPQAITSLIIDSILNNQRIHLPEKKDNLMKYDDILKNHFSVADTVKNRFSMQPEIEGVASTSTTYFSNPVFSGRRITCINLPLTTLYMIAFGNFPYSRMINETGINPDKSPRYCADLIVENKEDLLPSLQKELLKRFDLQAKIELRSKEVYILKVSDPQKAKNISLNTSGKTTYSSSHGEIDQQSITMPGFAEYLENYGSPKRLVEDETHLKNKFDIKFSFQPENPASLTKILSDMGLVLEKEQRNINMLIIYK